MARARRLRAFVILFAFWLVFSGYFDPLHIGLGVLCSALVAVFSHDLLFPYPPSSHTARTMWRLAAFIPWLIWQVIGANLHVVYLVFRPSQIPPRVIRFRTKLTHDSSKLLFGNSITLTPGTVTMDIEEDEFFVHAISDKPAKDTLSGDMEYRVAHVFSETLGTGSRSNAGEK